MAIIYTETHFGIYIHRERLSADGGRTWKELPLNDADAAELITDVANMFCRELSARELADLRELIG